MTFLTKLLQIKRKITELIYFKLIYLINLLTWLFMTFIFIDCDLKEVNKRQYKLSKKVPLIGAGSQVSDDQLSFLKFKSDEIKERRNRVDAKARTLLTLTSFLLGFLASATSIASSNNNSNNKIGSLSVIPILLLFINIYLLSVYFGIDTRQTVDYSYIFLPSSSGKIMLCNDLLKSHDYNERVTDFMVDLYNAALRYFFVAMLFIGSLGIWSAIL